jgi:saccharopine dehydrogenase (NAD+, L-lysine forming)
VKILMIGAGGVGTAAVGIATRRDFFDLLVVSDYDVARAERAVARYPDDQRSGGRAGGCIECRFSRRTRA